MKRLLMILMSLIIAIPLALGTVAGVSYYNTRVENIPSPAMVVLDQNVTPSGHTWREPVFGGFIHKDFALEPQADAYTDLGLLSDSLLPVTFPTGYSVAARVLHNGSEVFSGSAQDLSSYLFTANGRYQVDVSCEKPEDNTEGYGTLEYRFAFSVSVDPCMETGNDWVKQGDVLAIRMLNLGGDVTPVVDTPMEHSALMRGADGHYTLYVPVSHDLAAGGGQVTVTAGEDTWTVDIRMVEASFPMQQVPEPTPALTPEEYEAQHTARLTDIGNYTRLVGSLVEVADTEQYWSGRFTTPVEGDIITEYGLFQYYPGAAEPVRHTGIDISAVYNTPVVAPAAGRVVYVGRTAFSGNTVVIEHGGGLKSYLCQLSSTTVEVDSMVEQGQQIGAVGATGYASEPHLHWEVRIGYSTLNPVLLTNGTSGLYYFN